MAANNLKLFKASLLLVPRALCLRELYIPALQVFVQRHEYHLTHPCVSVRVVKPWMSPCHPCGSVVWLCKLKETDTGAERARKWNVSIWEMWELVCDLHSVCSPKHHYGLCISACVKVEWILKVYLACFYKDLSCSWWPHEHKTAAIARKVCKYKHGLPSYNNQLEVLSK